MRIAEIVKLLRKGAHILSKDYHDGSGRHYWLRDEDQEDLAKLTREEFQKVKERVLLERIPVISSDDAYWYEVAKK